MKLDVIQPLPITKNTAKKIVGICFNAAALEMSLNADEIMEIKKMLSSDTLIQNRLKNLIGSGNLVQFIRRLTDLKNTTEELLKLSYSLAFEFQGKTNINESLKNLDASLASLQNEMASPLNADL